MTTMTAGRTLDKVAPFDLDSAPAYIGGPCPGGCGGRDQRRDHVATCLERASEIAKTVVYAETLDRPPSEVAIRDLIGRVLGRIGHSSWDDAGAITRCVLALGWRPAVKS